MRNMLRRMSAVIAIALSASCMVSIDSNSSEESLGESAQAFISCSVDCDCPLGLYCDSGLGRCSDLDFGPPPEYVPCYGNCQCQSNERCQFSPYGGSYGQCVPLVAKSCGPCPASKDCRCGGSCWPKSMACP